MATTSTKRPRAPSSPSSSLRASSGSQDPPHKASRIIPTSSDFSDVTSTSGSSDTTVEGFASSTAPLLCNLPPTCHRQPTPIANTTELERHYAKYHAHVCEQRGCGCVFPEARLLDLHQTECHDPLAQIRKERGEKIFQCHIPSPTCGRSFLTPKARRLHLIQSHSYPKEYFFAVTNKGIGGLLKRWGEGASMVRKEWKPREGTSEESRDADLKRYRDEESDKMDENDDDDDSDDGKDDTGEESEDSEEPNGPFVEDEDEDENAIDVEATPRMLPRTTGIASPQSLISTPEQKHNHVHAKGTDNVDVTGLVNSLDSLSLIPDSIRFGRGGKVNGFASTVGGHASRATRPRGRGVSGRGRGRGEMPAPNHTGTRGRVAPRGEMPNVSTRKTEQSGSAGYSATPLLAEDPVFVGIPRGVKRGRGRGERAKPRALYRGRGI